MRHSFALKNERSFNDRIDLDESFGSFTLSNCQSSSEILRPFIINNNNYL